MGQEKSESWRLLLLNRRDIFVESKSEAYAELVLPSLAMVSWNYKDNLSHHEHRPTPPAASHGQEYLDGADMTVIVVHLIQKTNAMRRGFQCRNESHTASVDNITSRCRVKEMEMGVRFSV